MSNFHGKSQYGYDQIPAQLIQARGKTLCLSDTGRGKKQKWEYNGTVCQ